MTLDELIKEALKRESATTDCYLAELAVPLARRCKRMKEALEWYARSKNYEVYHNELTSMHEQATQVTDDKGDIARSALAEIDEEKK